MYLYIQWDHIILKNHEVSGQRRNEKKINKYIAGHKGIIEILTLGIMLNILNLFF